MALVIIIIFVSVSVPVVLVMRFGRKERFGFGVDDGGGVVVFEVGVLGAAEAGECEGEEGDGEEDEEGGEEDEEGEGVDEGGHFFFLSPVFFFVLIFPFFFLSFLEGVCVCDGFGGMRGDGDGDRLGKVKEREQ